MAKGYILLYRREARARQGGGECKRGLIFDVRGGHRISTPPRLPGQPLVIADFPPPEDFSILRAKISDWERERFGFVLVRLNVRQVREMHKQMPKVLRVKHDEMLAAVDAPTRAKLQANFHARGIRVSDRDMPEIPVMVMKGLFRNQDTDDPIDVGD